MNDRPPSTSPLLPGAAYFGLVFAAGFALGAVRTQLLVPRFSELTATLLEMPFILTACWFACGWTLRHFAVPSRARTRWILGGVAFALLRLAELGLTFALGRTAADHFAHLGTAAGALGLAGQVVYGLLPVLRRGTPAGA